MNAVFIHKRNESVNRMWACLAGAEFAVWVVSSLPLDMDNGLTNLLVLVFPLCAFCLVIAALFHYVVACEHYASAKGSKKPSESAGMANLFSLFVSLFFIALSVAHQSFRLAYFAVPFTFALGALPLKCLRDRC